MAFPLAVKGITAEDFASWRHNPVSKVVRKFLEDYADAIGKEALSRFIDGGSLTESAQQEMRGRLLAARELAELSFESLASFYQEEKEENAAETHSD